MNIKTINLLLLFLLSSLTNACDSIQSTINNHIIIKILELAKPFNLLFAFGYEEILVADLFYSGLSDSRWNEEKMSLILIQ